MYQLTPAGRQNLIEFIIDKTIDATEFTAAQYVDSLDADVVDWDLHAIEIKAHESKDGLSHVWDWDNQSNGEIFIK